MNKKETKLWDYLINYSIATDEEISLVCCINGTTLETLESILYTRTGYRTLKQIKNQ